MRLQMAGALKRAHGFRFASSSAFEDIERELQSSIKSQKERIAKIDKAFKAQAQAGPWRLAAIASSGFALLCAWRLFIDKREFQVRNFLDSKMMVAFPKLTGFPCAGQPDSSAGISQRSARYDHKVWRCPNHTLAGTNEIS